MLIILDTNAARIDLRGADAELLRVIAKSGQQKVGVPWMVLEELVAQRVIEHRKARQAATKALAELNRHTPWEKDKTTVSGDDSESDARRYWTREYMGIFEVIPTSEEALRSSLVREASRLKPAKDSERKGGARDVAIWLSIVEYARKNPTEHVFFVTANSSDFGDGVSWPHPMSDDIAGMEDRVTLLGGRSEVISTFTEPVSGVSEDDVRALLDKPGVTAYVSGYLVAISIALAGLGYWLGSPFVMSKGVNGRGAIGAKPVALRAWIDLGSSGPRLQPWKVEKISGHKVGDNLWYTADVEWIVAGWALSQQGRAVRAFGAWKSRILLSGVPGESPSILGCDNIPRPFSTEEISSLGELKLDPDTIFPDIPVSAIDRLSSYIWSHDQLEGGEGAIGGDPDEGQAAFPNNQLVEPSFGPLNVSLGSDELTVKATVDRMESKDNRALR